MFLPEVSHRFPRSLRAGVKLHKKRCCPKRWYEANAINCSVLSVLLFVHSLFMSEGITDSGWGKTKPSCFMCVWEWVWAQGRNRISVGLKPKPSDPHALTRHKKFSRPPRQRGEMEKGGKKFKSSPDWSLVLYEVCSVAKSKHVLEYLQLWHLIFIFMPPWLLCHLFYCL